MYREKGRDLTRFYGKSPYTSRNVKRACAKVTTKTPQESSITKWTDLGRSVGVTTEFSVFKLIELVIMRVYYTIPLGLSFFRHCLALFYNYFLWRSLTRVYYPKCAYGPYGKRNPI